MKPCGGLHLLPLSAMQSVHKKFPPPIERAPLAFSTFWMQPIRISIVTKRGRNMSSELQAALIGALIGGLLSLLAIMFSHYLQSKAAEKAEENLINGFIWSIHTEILAAYNRYMATLGAHVEGSQENTPLFFHYLIQEDYFTIFNNNSELIGRIKDPSLRIEIIDFYTLAKGMVDTFRQNTDFTKRFEEFRNNPQLQPQDVYEANSINYYRQLSTYGDSIRNGHQTFKGEAVKLISRIEKEIPLR